MVEDAAETRDCPPVTDQNTHPKDPVRPSELPWWWLLFIAVPAVIALAFWKFAWVFPTWITRAYTRVPEDRWHLVAAIYLSGVISSHIAGYLARRFMDWLFGIRYREREEGEREVETYFPPALVGFAEAILYPTALLLRQPEFIAIWLALKVAGQWKDWEIGYQGRARFNRFLVGNALTIMVGGLTYGAIKSFVLYSRQ